MFRSARWRSDKNKIKTIFKLQFHATQVAPLNVDALVISVVPGDVGKSTSRLEKGIIRDGSCRWECPIYETVKFNRDVKTGKITERIYHFVVSTGSSKNSIVGEASIDFADYAEISKPSTVSISLKNSKSNGVLHVSIQRLQANVDQREVEETDDTSLKFQSKTLNSLLSVHDINEGIKSHSNEVEQVNSATHNSEENGDLGMSSVSDVTLSSSESSSGLNTPRELGFRNNMLQDTSSFLLSQSQTSAPYKSSANGSTTIYEEHQQSQWEWQADSDLGISTDGSTNSSQGRLARETSQQASDVDIENLKAEIIALSRQVDVSEMELQTLRKQIVKESKRGQDLLREVSGLKEERNAFKAECEKLKALQKYTEDTKSKNKMQFESGDPRAILEEIRQELNYEKDLNANLRLQLQKTQESNEELILAVKDLEEMLQQKDRETSDPSSRSRSRETAVLRSESDDDEEQKALEELVKEHTDAKEAYLLEQKIMDLCNELEIYRRDKDDLEMQMEQLALDYEILKQENHDMSNKLEQSQLQEQLKMQYECSTFPNLNELEAQIQSLDDKLKNQSKEYSDSLATISELQSHIQSLEQELKKQSKGYSDSLGTINELQTHIQNLENECKKQSEEYFESLGTINELQTHSQSLENELKKRSKGYSNSLAVVGELETHIKNLEEELEKQALGFEADLQAITNAKIEQEQRAIRAEEALRKTRWKNANTAEKLQEEFRRLSVQMASTFDANEKVAMNALSEASELRLQKAQLEELLRKANEELQSVRHSYEMKLNELSNQLTLKTDQIEQMVVKMDNKSKELEHQRKHEEELNATFSQKILRLKGELERLTRENVLLSEQAKQNENMKVELKQMKSAIQEAEALIERGSSERNELVSTIALMKKEAEKSLEELNKIRCLNDEKETAAAHLQSEFEALKTEYDELKRSLFEDELEKEKLRKQLLQLKGELKKKDDALASLEKKLKESNKRAAVSDGMKTPLRNKSALVAYGSKEVVNLKEKIKSLEGQIKLKETALETSARSFLGRERDLRSKIEELESILDDLNEKAGKFYNNSSHKLAEGNIGIASNGHVADDETSADKNLSSSMPFISKENGNAISSSNNGVILEKEQTTIATNNGNCNADELFGELSLLKERNKSMEHELKEMQERYSEISLKFAEVEGERQQLVMTVRNLKNAKKW